MAFLSLLEDRAKPKRSRDPLGFELVCSYFGRKATLPPDNLYCREWPQLCDLKLPV
jgi:hypothetical protein